jgi:predicted DNA-binding transcriptional regulator
MKNVGSRVSDRVGVRAWNRVFSHVGNRVRELAWLNAESTRLLETRVNEILRDGIVRRENLRPLRLGH